MRWTNTRVARRLEALEQQAAKTAAPTIILSFIGAKDGYWDGRVRSFTLERGGLTPCNTPTSTLAKMELCRAPRRADSGGERIGGADDSNRSHRKGG